jgi:hypothetical protein
MYMYDMIDCGRTLEEVASAQKLIEASAWHMPWAQHLITYPLINGDRPVELIRSIMATGMHCITIFCSASLYCNIKITKFIIHCYVL